MADLARRGESKDKHLQVHAVTGHSGCSLKQDKGFQNPPSSDKMVVGIWISLTDLNQCIMCAACPPCRQDWHHVNQLEKSANLSEPVPESTAEPGVELRPPILIRLWAPAAVPMFMRQMAHLGRGFLQLGHEDICKKLTITICMMSIIAYFSRKQ